MGRIKPGRPASGSDRIHTPPPPGGCISFSFRCWAATRKFSTAACGAQWFDGLLDRFRSLSLPRPQEVLSNRSPSLRAHPIDFTHTSEPGGFAHFNEQLRGYPAYPFQVSLNTGRVHGFFIDLVFFTSSGWIRSTSDTPEPQSSRGPVRLPDLPGCPRPRGRSPRRSWARRRSRRRERKPRCGVVYARGGPGGTRETTTA
jgi:hypothetical protein